MILPDNILQERAVICICYKWEGGKKVHSLQWDDGDDKAMLKAFLEVAHQADELVAHNGDKFDIKWFNTRCLFHGLDPFGDWKTVDTLVIAKRRFYFNSNRLDYLGKYLFNEGKIKTDFSLWHDIVIKGSKRAMRDMIRYCKQDVNLLERVWMKLEPYHKPKTHVGRLHGKEKWTCPYTGSENVIKDRTRMTAAGTTQHVMKCKDNGRYFTISDRALKDYYLEKK